jgi:transcriptional regulator with XRE-family HTH domain
LAVNVLAAIENKPGMTQKKLAEMLGVSPQYVSKILKGSENMTLETIAKLEDALGVNLIFTPSEAYPNQTSAFA